MTVVHVPPQRVCGGGGEGECERCEGPGECEGVRGDGAACFKCLLLRCEGVIFFTKTPGVDPCSRVSVARRVVRAPRDDKIPAMLARGGQK